MKKPLKASPLQVRPGVARLAFRSLGILPVGFLSACAGPVTPLGAVWAWSPSQVDIQSQEPETEDSVGANARSFTTTAESIQGPKITFRPDRQVLHGPAPVRVQISDQLPQIENFDAQQLVIRYNGVNVTSAFLAQSRIVIEPVRQRVRIENPVVRLLASEDHRIEMRYRDSKGVTISAIYEAPVCRAFGLQRVRDTAGFKPSDEMVRSIDRIATYGGLNPAFFTALVAQESAFDSGQVSWARALGLTQITSTAESEVAREHPAWPRFPMLGDLPFLRLKYMIASGEINATNEWRLDPEKSLEGGVAYARRMAEKWSSPTYLPRINRTFREPQVGLAKLTLSSYHSGFTRTLSAFSRLGRGFLKDKELNEAQKYVNRIFSYCHHFSEGVGSTSASNDERSEIRYAQAP